MNFWANLQMKHAPDDDVGPMEAFQKELQQGFYSYIEKAKGRKVRQHPQSTIASELLTGDTIQEH
jgi:hypothetical protein